MFKFLKDKLKGAISKISEGIEKEGKKEENIVESEIPQKGFFAKIKEKFVPKEQKKETFEDANAMRQGRQPDAIFYPGFGPLVWTDLAVKGATRTLRACPTRIRSSADVVPAYILAVREEEKKNGKNRLRTTRDRKKAVRPAI